MSKYYKIYSNNGYIKIKVKNAIINDCFIDFILEGNKTIRFYSTTIKKIIEIKWKVLDK